MMISRLAAMASSIGLAVLPIAAHAADADVVNPPPTAKDWAQIAQLPDWSGVWFPSFQDEFAQIVKNPAPWNPEAAKQIAVMEAEEKAGRPRGLFIDCLPEGMPSWMLITHNGFEVIYSPGRVTLLGESDGNRLRRIYTDGRPHPADPDPTFHGHSIGHWEGDTLVVDTIGILPEAYLAVSESVGLPNNGDLHIVERIHLTAPGTLHDDLEITAPHLLTGTWKTTRFFTRQRARKFDIVEGVCLQGSFTEGKDKDGNAVFLPLRQDNGNPISRPN